MQRTVLLVASLLLFVACSGRKVKQAIEKHRAAATAQLAKLRTLAAKIEAQPPITATEWKLPAGTKLDLRAMDYGEYGKPKHEPRATYNTAFTHAAYLVAPCRAEWVRWSSAPGSDLFIMLVDHSHDWLEEPACYLENGFGKMGSEPPEASIVDERLDQLSRTKYVLALRLRQLVEPRLNLGKDGGKDTFTPGAVVGDVVLFDVTTGEYLGGFPVNVTNPDTAKVHSGDQTGQLRLQLSGLVSDLIKKEIGAVGTIE